MNLAHVDSQLVNDQHYPRKQRELQLKCLFFRVVFA